MSLLAFFDSSVRWHKGYYAQTVHKEDCRSNDPEAVCWCITGAAQIVYDGVDREPIYGRIAAAIKKLFPTRMEVVGNASMVARFNDHPDTTFSDVVSVLREAGV